MSLQRDGGHLTPKRILVTGGLGFIGAHLSQLLHSLGHTVAILDARYVYAGASEFITHRINLRYRDSLLLDGIPRQIGSTFDRSVVKEVIEDFVPDTIVHLANWPLTSIPEAMQRQAYQQIVTGTEVLLELLSTQTDRFVYASSSLVYGDFPVHPVPETIECSPNTKYGCYKLLAEQRVRAACAQRAISHVIVRPTAVYGPGDTNRRVVQSVVESGCLQLPLNIRNPDRTRLDFTFVADLAQGIARATLNEAARDQTFNLSFGTPHSLNCLLRIGREHFPNLSWTETCDDSPWTRGALDISKARDLLGFSPQVDLAKGMAKYVNFVRERIHANSSVPESIDD